MAARTGTIVSWCPSEVSALTSGSRKLSPRPVGHSAVTRRSLNLSHPGGLPP